MSQAQGGEDPGGSGGGLPVVAATATAECAPAFADLIDGLGAEGSWVHLLRVSAHRSERLMEGKEEEGQGVQSKKLRTQGS